jgi:hypothetical protein
MGRPVNFRLLEQAEAAASPGGDADTAKAGDEQAAAGAGRERKAVVRWSDDPLSVANLGGRQSALDAING